MADTVRILTPVDGSVWTERPIASDQAVEAAVTTARQAQPDWAALDLDDRAALCTRFVDAVVGLRDKIVPELAWQMGRPVTFGPGELSGFAERGHHMISIAPDALAPVELPISPGFERSIQRVPVGVVLCVAPWNYPLLTAVNTIIPAVMAGNTVVLKHASQTLVVGDRFQEAAGRAGLPEGIFTNLVLSHRQVAHALGQRWFDRVNFTGSVEAGRTIERSAAGTFAGVGLELGGKDPAYVRPDADLAHTVENVVDGAFFNSGQSCCGIERVYVHRSVYDETVDAMAEAVAGYRLGSPLDAETTMGPMVTARAADEVRAQISDATASGATAIVGPDRFGDADGGPGSPYLAPTLLTGVDHSMEVMAEESFGPVLGVMPVDDDAEAVRLMNDSPYGLTASIWTADVEAARSIGRKLETGTVFMNRADYLDPALAWTGVKDTGRGVTLSALGYAELTRPKSFHLRVDLG
jgi:acyl-CoA reductase-like NAD-dependent aldehyde dehydrogenase